MIRFDCDYLEGAHPKILKRIVEANYDQDAGYSKDKYTKSAKEKIKKALKRDDVDVHILVSGTQTNMTVISSILRSYQAVICADTGHINVHEVGAVESLGNKIISISNDNGKITGSQIESIVKGYFENPMSEHMVMPKLVFISLPTECGTNYTKKDLEEIYNVCKENNLYLYIDGARLGYGLGVPDSDVTLPDIAKYTDAFYIGGTKVGALFGEALVFTKDNTPSHFTTRIKQHGDLLAKGFLVGMQFDVLFTDDLYVKGARRAIELSDFLREELRKKNYEFYSSSPTNQIFIIMENEKLAELEEKVGLSIWGAADENRTIVRFVISWATTKEEVEALIDLM